MDDEWCAMDGDITYLGRVAARLPIGVKLSKLIMLGYIYGCLDEAVIMGENCLYLNCWFLVCRMSSDPFLLSTLHIYAIK